MRKPQVPAAGSYITSFGVGAVISTIRRIMCRGVRNCPFCPEFASFPSMYSYTSPLVSLSSMGMWSIRSTTLASSAGVGMVNRASRM